MVDMLFHEIIRSRRIKLIILHQRNPHGASLACHLDMWVHPANLDRIRIGRNRTARTYDTDMFGTADCIH